ncbi:acyltransferase, partial [Salmonella enterica]|nr:acyltransferase [Salmonella enterica]
MKLTEKESLCLDLIRAIASQLVLIGHGISYFGIFKILHEPNFPWMQNIAVVIFFILSGFVITYSTIIKTKNKDYNFENFFSDRASRIFSAYIVALFVIFLIDFCSQSIDAAKYIYQPAYNASTFVYNIFMLQDFPLWGLIFNNEYKPTSFGSARVLWTISIEWWFYMFFGVVFFTLIRKERISPLKITMFLFSIIVAWHYLYGSRGGHLTLYWALGMFIMLFYNKYKKITNGLKTNLIIFTLAFSACVITQIRVIDGYNLIFSIFLALVMLSLINISNYIDLNKIHSVIEITASYSFTLYLIHYTILDFIFRHIHLKNNYITFILSFVISNFF